MSEVVVDDDVADDDQNVDDGRWYRCCFTSDCAMARNDARVVSLEVVHNGDADIDIVDDDDTAASFLAAMATARRYPVSTKSCADTVWCWCGCWSVVVEEEDDTDDDDDRNDRARSQTVMISLVLVRPCITASP